LAASRASKKAATRVVPKVGLTAACSDGYWAAYLDASTVVKKAALMGD